MRSGLSLSSPPRPPPDEPERLYMLDPETMTLHLGSTPEGSTSVDCHVRLEATDLAGSFDIVSVSPEGRLTLEVLVRDTTAVVRGRLAASVTVSCARCLEEFPVEVDESFVRTFSWAAAGDDDPEVEFIPSRRHPVSVLDGVREAIILSVPRMPLCDEGCRGLCPSCGANLNREDCRHTRA